MSRSTHTYGPSCHLAKPVTSGSRSDDDIPDMNAQFFYSALYHIDDPLSAVPTTTGSDSKSTKHPPRPFSALDNNCLEAAWLGLGSERDRKNHNKTKLRKASRPSQSDRLGSVIGTLGAKPEQKKRSAVEGTIPDAKASATSAPNQSSSKASQRHSRFSADASSEHPSSNSTCPCEESHDTCKSKSGHCNCISCPKASGGKKSRHYDSKSPFPTRSEKPKENPDATGTGDNEAKALHGDMKKSAAYCEAQPKTEAKGNPFNPNCDDALHIPLDLKAAGCCSDYEGKKSNPSHTGSVPQEKKVVKSSSDKCELGECQKDGTNDTIIKKASRSVMEQKSSQSPATAPKCELSSKEHSELEKHENSKEHQAFSKHLQSKHLDVKNSESTVRKQKESDKGAMPSIPTDLTNRPDKSNDAGTTGCPFLKLPSRPTTPQLPSTDPAPHKRENPDLLGNPAADSSKADRERDDRGSTETEAVLNHKCKAHKNTKNPVDIPVGVSRLHKVCLPALQMEPIYWSPVNDVASVTRGTWFYKQTMFPVEPSVANQLEMGYREMRPWSQTWKDELRSAMDIGAAGEEKITYRLWPKDEDKSVTSDDILSADPYCAARCFQGEAAAEGEVDPDELDKNSSDTKTIVKKYPNCQVVYKDFHTAFILKPNLQPSAYHKRRPLQRIQKGLIVGIPVCRGFDWKAWEKLHPSKKTNIASKAEEHAAVSGDSDFGKRDACSTCRSQEPRQECTDLCLVIHGIGQKLSERMESFHFTHAINAFRRSVNVELSNDGVQKVCRDDLGGVMVLPVNWRSNLDFEDGNPSKNGEHDHSGSNFTLKDITQPSIPAIRSMISDVMLDVPYYMSHNKEKMVQACICEANRVYRLWCKNNPEFSKNGRVHLIAHSLGSVMAMEILSKQPTLVPKVDSNGKKPNIKQFEFNTANLFCVGSPAGFFLLLEKRRLMPRKGQNKPGAELGDDKDKSIVSDQGTFGCLAVDNIYNVMHTNDPIAYRLNASADSQYAAGLKNAHVPSATTGFFESLGNAMGIKTPGSTAPANVAVGQLPKPTITARMPSQLEMEVHDFTAEEKAEKKFHLLNDNGQIDYCLSSGGGPLEIQYLNMLSAHSSYWTSPDFIRMLCTEVGRKPGKANCLPNMKAVKIRHKP
jgi:hypothetical protein